MIGKIWWERLNFCIRKSALHAVTHLEFSFPVKGYSSQTSLTRLGLHLSNAIHSVAKKIQGSTVAAGDERAPALASDTQDQKLQTGITTPLAFNVFNQRISCGDWKQNVPDSDQAGAAGRQKLARLTWLFRVKIARYCSHLPEKVQAFVSLISKGSCSNGYSGSYCLGKGDLKLVFQCPDSVATHLHGIRH